MAWNKIFRTTHWLGLGGCWLMGYLLVLDTGCANIVPPMGGPRDSLPPFLLQGRPADSSTRFTGKKIILEFNEFVELDRITEQLIMTPTPKMAPEVSARLRTVNITIKDTLEPNTTYAFDFGDAIQDVNERNVLKGFSYVVTTGEAIDSFRLSGTVTLAETGKADSTLMVLLHAKMDDSAVVKEKPRYVTRVNNKGQFTFRYLPKGQFRLYALKDESGSRKYLSAQQLFAFADAPVAIDDSTQPVRLYAYAEPEEKKPTAAAPRTPGARPAAPEKQEKLLRVTNNLENGELDLLQQLEFTFKQAPLKNFDSSQLAFSDEAFRPITAYRIVLDTSGSRLTLEYNWKENTEYHIIVNPSAMTDTAGRQLAKTDTLIFRTRKKEAYGSVRLRFPKLDLSQKPVLQFIQNDKVVYTHVFSSTQFSTPLFKPGDYEMRILLDANGNGQWDPGNFWKDRKQPERVLAVDRKLTIKANWDNEIDITLSDSI